MSISSDQKAAQAGAVAHGTVALAVVNPSMEQLTALAGPMLIRILDIQSRIGFKK